MVMSGRSLKVNWSPYRKHLQSVKDTFAIKNLLRAALPINLLFLGAKTYHAAFANGEISDHSAQSRSLIRVTTIRIKLYVDPCLSKMCDVKTIICFLYLNFHCADVP